MPQTRGGRPARVFVASGHGDGTGATANGIVEAELNAVLSARLVERLRDHGIDTRTDLEAGNPGFPEEADLARSIGDIAYYIAVHHNAHTSAARGAEAFGTPGASADFASALHDAQLDALRVLDPTLPDRGVKDGQGTGAAKHLRYAPGTVAVLEPCFITNEHDARLCTEPRYVPLLAESLCRTIVDHGRVGRIWETIYEPQDCAVLPPVFSVVVATYARAQLLPAAVASALAQSVSAIEVIVVDDGSPMPVAPFDDERVRVVRLDTNSGPSAARNAGIAVARGRYVAFLDDDDLWTPNRLDLALEGLRRAPVSICWTRHLDRPEGDHRILNGRVGADLLTGTTPCLGATAIRRSVAPRFDERWTAVEDVEWWWRVADAQPVATVPEVGYLVRLHDGERGKNTVAARVRENRELLRERRDFFKQHRAAAAYRWLRIGVLSASMNDDRGATYAFLRHAFLAPGWTSVGRVLRSITLWAGVGRRRVQHAKPVAQAAALRVTHLVSTDHARGAELVAGWLADALTPYGIDRTIVALVGCGGRDTAQSDAVLARSRFATLPLLAFRLRRQLRTEPARVVIAHGVRAALAATLATRGTPTRVVWQRILEMPTWPRWHPHHVRLRWLARSVDAVFAITPKTADEVRRLGFRGPVWHVPNHRPLALFAGYSHETSANQLRVDLGVPRDAPLLGLVGRLVLQKAPGDAIEVLRILHEHSMHAHLVVVGDGPRRRAFEQQVAASGLASFVHVLGHRDDVPLILSAIDVLLLPSQSDSMPGVVIEAQLAGCPVVAYPVDGISLALDPGRSGLVTTESTPAAMASAVDALLRDPARRLAMRCAAVEHARHVTTEELAPRYLRLLSVVAGNEGADGPVRVLHVLPDLGVGGAEQALAVLATNISSTDVTQVVATISGARRPLDETVYARLQENGVGYCDLGVQSRPTRSLRALATATVRLGRLARRLDVDVVDASLLDAALPSRLAFGRWARVTHLVNTTWDPVTSVGRSRAWRAHVLRLIDRASSVRDTKLVALTEPVAKSARRYLGVHRKVVVIPRGVDVDRFTPVAAAPRAASADAPLSVVAIGRLVRQKGHDVLIRAVVGAARAGTPLRLKIVGEGPLHRELSLLVKSLDAEEIVDMLPPVTDVREILRDADVFALASRWEGQSNAVLEAMAMGLPVLVSDLEVFREVVGDAGVLAPCDDVAAWQSSMSQLARNSQLREQLGFRARFRAETLYPATARSADLVALYRSLVVSRRPH